MSSKLAYADEMVDTIDQLKEVAGKDIFTDAPECYHQIERLQNLICHLTLLARSYEKATK